MNQVLADMHRERQERAALAVSEFRVAVDGGRSIGVRVLEKHGESLGSSLWSSSEALARFLGMQIRELQAARGGRQLHVLELGCGIGLPGILCALQGCQVTLTDRSEVLGMTHKNVAANDIAHAVTVAELVWGSALPHSCAQADFDLVIGADILYRSDQLDALLHTLLQVSRPQTEVFLAYKQRIKSDERFFAAAARDFEITTLWCEAGSVTAGPQELAALDNKSTPSSWPALPGTMRASGDKGREDVGEWVSGATCRILRFHRLPVSSA